MALFASTPSACASKSTTLASAAHCGTSGPNCPRKSRSRCSCAASRDGAGPGIQVLSCSGPLQRSRKELPKENKDSSDDANWCKRSLDSSDANLDSNLDSLYLTAHCWRLCQIHGTIFLFILETFEIFEVLAVLAGNDAEMLQLWISDGDIPKTPQAPIPPERKIQGLHAVEDRCSQEHSRVLSMFQGRDIFMLQLRPWILVDSDSCRFFQDSCRFFREFFRDTLDSLHKFFQYQLYHGNRTHGQLRPPPLATAAASATGDAPAIGAIRTLAGSTVTLWICSSLHQPTVFIH